MNLPLKTSLAMLLVFGLGAPALAQDVGVADSSLKELDYLPSRKVDRTLRDRIAAEVGIATPGKVRRVQFDYDQDGAEFAVRGVVVEFPGLLVERYRVRSLARAVRFADHGRIKSDSRLLLEVRGKEVLVLTGSETRSRKRTIAIREAAWGAGSGAALPDLLELKAGQEDSLIRVSAAALAASPETKAKLNQAKQLVDVLGGVPGAKREDFENGGFRLEFDDGILSLRTSSAGDVHLGQHPSATRERSLERFLAQALPAPAPPASPSTGGIAAALQGEVQIPTTLYAEHSAKKFRANLGQMFEVSLRGNAASTGYEWQALVPAGMKLVSRWSDPHPAGGTREVFVFRAETAGVAELRLHYVRPGNPTSPGEVFEATIRTQ